jgi:TRAP-type C4-dicarboxylate transport system permease small subunit
MIDSAERMIGRVEEAAAVGLLLAIAGLVNLQIVARYVFDSPFIWPEEITKILLIWLCYVAAGAVTRRSAHIAVDTFVLTLPRVLRLAVMILLDLITIALFGALAVIGTRLVASVGGMKLIATGLPTSVLVWPVIIGGGLIVLHSALRVMRNLRGIEAPAP